MPLCRDKNREPRRGRSASSVWRASGGAVPPSRESDERSRVNDGEAHRNRNLRDTWKQGPEPQHAPLRVRPLSGRSGSDADAIGAEVRARAATLLNQILELSTPQRRLRLGTTVEIVRNFDSGLQGHAPVEIKP
jgi:hypothetical protein